jgi:hypothetical protein
MRAKIVNEDFTLSAADLVNFVERCGGDKDLREIPIRCFGRYIASVRLLELTQSDGKKDYEVEFFALSEANGLKIIRGH